MDARRWPLDIVEIGDRIAALTAADAADLGRYLERAYGIAAAPLTVRPDREPDPEPTPPPAPSVFAVRLDGYSPADKIGVVKAVREVTGLGLKEALALAGQAPCVVKEGLIVPSAEPGRPAPERDRLGPGPAGLGPDAGRAHGPPRPAAGRGGPARRHRRLADEYPLPGDPVVAHRPVGDPVRAVAASAARSPP
jgi:large subunit ribosomal protein L7/L12